MYRVSEFEKACMNFPDKIVIRLIEYVPKTLFVHCMFGLVVLYDRTIEVAWDKDGKAFVGGIACIEFDLQF